VSYTEFEFAFWHPFGPHAGETREEIIARKQKEIKVNGWTLWSFQHRLMLEDWHRELSVAERNEVFVFCSEGRGASEPAGTPLECKSYRFVGETEWRSMPKGVSAPHNFRPGKTEASAFVVRRVICPVEPFQRIAVEWLKKEGPCPWCQSKIPTYGEYLIRPGGTIAMRKVSAVLELKPPYLAYLRADMTGGKITSN